MNNLAYIQTGPQVGRIKPQTASPLVSWGRRIKDFFILRRGTTDAEREASMKWATKQLMASGLSRFQMERRESRHIINYLRPSEQIIAAVRGHIRGLGGVLLVATDERILYLHDIPLFSNFEEFPYDVVTGISLNRVGILSSVTLFTKFKTYELDYVNTIQAEKFVDHIESIIYSDDFRQAAMEREEAPMY